jgi:1,4-dihydroxy-2-naphthoate octaprenyltransferase
VAYASRSVPLDPALAVLTGLAALALQLGTNFANDYYDFRSGIDTRERLGPVRAAAAGLLEPAAVHRAAFGAVAVALVLGAYLVARGGLPILMIGVAAAVCAVAYSAGPAPLASLGLGEILAFVFFGVVAVVGAALLQGLELGLPTFVLAIPVAALVTAIMVVNNLRDIATDSASGKRTLAVVLGDRGTRGEYTLLIGASFAALPFVALDVGPKALLPCVLVPLGAVEVRHLWGRRGSELNASLAGTARLHLLFGVLYVLGILP